jgi:hypothetical protein
MSAVRCCSTPTRAGTRRGVVAAPLAGRWLPGWCLTRSARSAAASCGSGLAAASKPAGWNASCCAATPGCCRPAGLRLAGLDFDYWADRGPGPRTITQSRRCGLSASRTRCRRTGVRVSVVRFSRVSWHIATVSCPPQVPATQGPGVLSVCPIGEVGLGRSSGMTRAKAARTRTRVWSSLIARPIELLVRLDAESGKRPVRAERAAVRDGRPGQQGLRARGRPGGRRGPGPRALGRRWRGLRVVAVAEVISSRSRRSAGSPGRPPLRRRR